MPSRPRKLAIAADKKASAAHKKASAARKRAPDAARSRSTAARQSTAGATPSAPVVPLRPGQVERHTHDYIRPETTDLFTALDIRARTMIPATHQRHRALEFRRFLDPVDRRVPGDLAIHLVLDSAATHQTARIRRWLAQRPRYHVHFTPISASWLNLVECWCSILAGPGFRSGVRQRGERYVRHEGWRQAAAAPEGRVTQGTSNLVQADLIP